MYEYDWKMNLFKKSFLQHQVLCAVTMAAVLVVHACYIYGFYTKSKYYEPAKPTKFPLRNAICWIVEAVLTAFITGIGGFWVCFQWTGRSCC